MTISSVFKVTTIKRIVSEKTFIGFQWGKITVKKTRIITKRTTQYYIIERGIAKFTLVNYWFLIKDYLKMTKIDIILFKGNFFKLLSENKRLSYSYSIVDSFSVTLFQKLHQFSLKQVSLKK